VKAGGAIAVVVLVLAALAWLFLRGRGPDDEAGTSEDAARSRPSSPSPAPSLEGSRGLEPVAPPEAPRHEPPPVAPPVGTGTRLVVTVVRRGGARVPAPTNVRLAFGSGATFARDVDEAGKATFEGIPAGKANVDAFARGFLLSWDSSVEVEPDRTNETTLWLEPGVSLDGTVVDARDGRPVADAVVDVRGGGQAANVSSVGGRASYGAVRTDADGRFRTPGLPFDFIVTMSVRARGYRLAERSMSLQAVEGARAPLEFRLEPGGTLRGTVRDADGAPVAGARVVVRPRDAEGSAGDDVPNAFPQEGAEPPIRVATDARGEYVAEGLALETAYCAVASADGHARSNASCEARPTAERPEARADLALRRPGRLLVRVRGPGGEPVGGEVRIGTEERALDADGSAAFAGMTPGEYLVSVAAAGHVDVRERVEVREGEHVTKTVVVSRGESVSGIVVDAEGKPVKGADVRVSRDVDPPSYGAATSDEKGRFAVSGLLAGPHRVEATGDGARARPMDGVAVPSAGVQVVLERDAKVTVRFVAPDGVAPPETLKVWEFEEDGSGSGGDQAWNGGRVEGVVPVGRNLLVVEPPGFVPWTHEWDATSGQRLDLGDVVLDVGVEVSGRVVDGAGRPVAGAVVEVDERGENKAQSGDDGRFRLSHVARRSVRLAVYAEGFVPATVHADGARPSAPVHVRMSRGGRLVATLTARSGGAPRDVWLHVHAPESGEPPPRGTYAWEDADEKGRASALLQPGRYRVDVLREDDVVATAEATVEEGKETPVAIEVPDR
jgi:protocatechuate 3,4-dioxygenase beta subunit